jgi:hypothetical protein
MPWLVRKPPQGSLAAALWAKAEPAGQRAAQGAGQLAWLTEDMLKPSTRSGGMMTRLK